MNDGTGMRAASAGRRVERELRTVRAMVGMYCRHHHRGAAELCEPCAALWAYARQRALHCPFGADKPTCRNCPVHCYRPELREEIRAVMRFAGPRMALRHPVLALLHSLDGWRRCPVPGTRSTPSRRTA